jgi:site-specific DNA-methyltransferase (adenine-specific)
MILHTNEFFESENLRINMLFKALQIDDAQSLGRFARKTRIPLNRLKYYNDTRKMPSGTDLDIILKEADISLMELMLLTGNLNRELRTLVAKNADHINRIISFPKKKEKSVKQIKPVFTTELGKLFQCDCMDLLETLENDSVDLVFADPPFNLKKMYPSGINDDLKADQYLSWCEKWIFECVRILNRAAAFLSGICQNGILR